jgi:mRNA interferase MazF
MPTFSQGDVVKVPFLYTNRPTRQSRPALVLAAGCVGAAYRSVPGLIWVLMITSAGHRGWPGDVALSDLSGTGLPAPSVIRTAKIATIEARDATLLGRDSETVHADVLVRVRAHLSLQRSEDSL